MAKKKKKNHNGRPLTHTPPPSLNGPANKKTFFCGFPYHFSKQFSIDAP